MDEADFERSLKKAFYFLEASRWMLYLLGNVSMDSVLSWVDAVNCWTSLDKWTNRNACIARTRVVAGT